MSNTLSGDRFAAELRGFGPIGVFALLIIVAAGPVFEPLGALLVLWWAHRSETPWHEIGFVRPRSWMGTLVVGIAFGAAFKILMKALVMPLLGADPINQAYHYLAGNQAALPGILFQVVIGAGFGEETVFRGFLFERLGKLFGPGWAAKIAILMLTSAWFGAIHYPVQGVDGVKQAVITGLVFGTVFMSTGRLWMVMVAHAAFDVTAVLIIYWNLEPGMAHLIFH